MDRGFFKLLSCASRGVQAVEASSCHNFARHTHNGYGIGRIVDGAQRSWIGRGSVEAGPGDIITVNPGEVHDGSPIGGARRWKMLYLAPEAVGAMVEHIRDDRTACFEFTHPVMTSRDQAEAFDAAYDAVAGPDADACRGEERLLWLFARMARDVSRPSPPDNLGLSRAKARIDDDPAASHTLADLARATGLSRFQIVRGFTKLTGLTPHSYIVQRRLDAARTMIAKSVALADAAAASGFADQSHFTRSFSSRYGFTPGAYTAALR